MTPQRHPAVGCNNAGVALLGAFEEISPEDFRWPMGVNFWGAVYGVKYFFPIPETPAGVC